MYPPLIAAQPETDTLGGLLYSTSARNKLVRTRFWFANQARVNLQRKLSIPTSSKYSDWIKHLILFQDKHHHVTMGRDESVVFWNAIGQAKKTGR
jgi:hypothetical protein